jgi:hypothetical protein
MEKTSRHGCTAGLLIEPAAFVGSKSYPGMIIVLTSSLANKANSNTQAASVQESVARLPPGKFRIFILPLGASAPHHAGQSNARLLPLFLWPVLSRPWREAQPA